ncbi:hypothetical protein [Deinococcus aluminii]|uniref:Uncharacterized protein n=1 Tax=Deinococcus aluminii TaxID=1656885 RepID=A0ABP9X9B1_9DEIO
MKVGIIGASGGPGKNAGMKPWLLPLFLSSVAVAGGVEPSTLPKLSLNARTVGRVADIQTVQGVPRADGPIFFFPTHVRAVLNRPGQHWQPRYDTELPEAYVAVYPVAGLLAQYPERGEPWNVRTQIDTLKALNSGRLKLNEVGAWGLPYLPLWNAHQVTAGAVRMVETPTLKGLRYLTVYSQEDGVRFPREAIFATFQGLSRDGRFYITAQMPYAPASLPTRAELDRTKSFEVAPVPAQGSGPAYDAYRQKVDAYNLDLKRKLDAEDAAAAVRNLDALVRSIRFY